MDSPDQLETILYHLGTNRLLHPHRSYDYLPRKDLDWLVDQARTVDRLLDGIRAALDCHTETARRVTLQELLSSDHHQGGNPP